MSKRHITHSEKRAARRIEKILSAPIHAGCGGPVFNRIYHDDQWGRMTIPVCKKCGAGPIVGKDVV